MGLPECRERLREIASRSGGAELAGMVGEAKLLRAKLVFAVGSTLGAPETASGSAAVAIELLHMASLVHDDIIDDAVERRGAPALHVAAGRDRALVVGDLLIVSAFEALHVVPADAFARCVETLGKHARQCCLGQLEELDLRDAALSEERYIAVAAMKTGSLFAAAASLGAHVAGAGPGDVAALAAFGTRLGVAYQIGDDLCDDAGTSRSARVAAQMRAVDAVAATLDGVPARCREELRQLTEAVFDRRPQS